MNKKQRRRLFHEHKVELFNMIDDIWQRAPIKPWLPTEEETAQYQKERDEFLNNEIPNIYQQLKDWGFDVDDSKWNWNNDIRECANCGRFQGDGCGCGEYVNTCMQDGDAYSNWIPQENKERI